MISEKECSYQEAEKYNATKSVSFRISFVAFRLPSIDRMSDPTRSSITQTSTRIVVKVLFVLSLVFYRNNCTKRKEMMSNTVMRNKEERLSKRTALMLLAVVCFV